MKSILRRALACAAFAGMLVSTGLSAQSIGWHAATYGEVAAVAGRPSQALAFDAGGGVFTLEMIADSALKGVRLKHFDAAGQLLWHTDLPTEIYPPTGVYDLAALTALGDDAVVATLGYDNTYRGQLLRFRGSDGTLLWQTTDPTPNGSAFEALSADTAGNILAAGTSVNWPLNEQRGHVAKFSADGRPLWTADIPATQCGAAPGVLVLSIVAEDVDGNVTAGGAPAYDKHVTACGVKLSGDAGTVLHAAGYSPAAALQTLGVIDSADAQGNLLIATQYFANSPSSWAVSLVRFDAASMNVTWAIDTLTLHGQQATPLGLAADGAGNAIVSGYDRTQSFAAATGQPLWATEANVGGAAAIGSEGSVLIGSDFASDSIVTTGRNFSYTALDPADGSVRWSVDQPIATFEYWDGPPRLAADANGHYAALQSQSHLCCTTQALLDYGDVADGAIGWTHADPDIGRGTGVLDVGADTSQTRSSVATPDAAVISSGSTTRWYASSYDHSAQLLTTKRAQRDGHLLWSQQATVGKGFCRRGGVVLDTNADAIVAGTCDVTPLVIKYRGSDGQVLWQASPVGDCPQYAIDAVVLDASNDVYISGACQYAASEDLITVKLAGASGSELWRRHTTGGNSGGQLHLSEVPVRLVLGQGQVYVAGNSPTDSSYNNMCVVVAALSPDDGHVVWTSVLNPPGGSVPSYSLDTLTALPGGDVVASVGGTAARLAAASGHTLWSNNAVPATDVVTTLDAAGDVVLAGGYDLWKLDAANGTMIWHQNMQQSPTPAGNFNDIVLTPTGNLLVAGIEWTNHEGLYVAQLADADGKVQWSTIDASVVVSRAVGVLPAADGAVIATANGYDDAGAPWWTVRIVTPQADLIFSNGMEL